MKKKTKFRLYSLLASSFIFFIALLNLLSFLTREKPTFIKESTDEAKKYWQDIVTHYPSFRDGYIALAQIEKDKGNLEAARILLEEAKKLSPNEEITQLSLR